MTDSTVTQQASMLDRVDERGASVIEYSLLVALVVAVLISVLSNLGTELGIHLLETGDAVGCLLYTSPSPRDA